MQETGIHTGVLLPVVAAMIMALVVPALGYLVLRRFTRSLDAAAIAAAYGSVSAVTFVTTVQYAEAMGLPSAPHMLVAMVLMESPAIIMALMLAARQQTASVFQASTVSVSGQGGAALQVGCQLGSRGNGGSLRHLRESLTNGTQVLLLGSLLVGYLSGPSGKEVMQPFSGDLFKGLLAFFLLDMGMTVARRMPDLKGQSWVVLGYGVVGPLMHASLALVLAWLLHLNVTEGLLLMVLSASASYIVVPAVLKQALPQANACLYLGMPLALTFPLNILLGIPLYAAAAQWALG